MLPPLGAGLDVSIGSGLSDPLASTVPPKDRTFELDDAVMSFRVRLRMHYSSFGGVFLFQKHGGSERNTGTIHSASSISLIIAPSYHVSLWDHRLRLETLAGLAHTRDASDIYKVASGYEYYYRSEFNKIGAGLGFGILVRPNYAIMLHGMLIHTTRPIEDDHMTVELIFPLTPKLLLYASNSRHWKDDGRMDIVYYLGLGVGNWVRQ